MDDADRNLTFLIADDQESVRKTIRDMLRAIGYRNFLLADDGDTALTKLRTNRVDFIVCDWNMPRLSGLEVLLQVRGEEAWRELPFIMITGEVETATVAQAIEAEVDAYLVKPFATELLHRKIQQVLDRRRHPSPTETHLSLGQVYLKGRLFDQALNEFSQAAALSPHSARPLTWIGQVHETRGDLAMAREYYQRAIDMVPKFITARDSLARVLLAQGDHDQAARHLEAAVSVSPKNVQRQLGLGQALIASGRPEAARQAMSQAIQAVGDQERAEIARQVGEVMLQAGQDEAAQEAFEQGIKSSPDEVHFYNRLGIALRQQGKIEEAVANYERALEIEPDNEILFYNLGRACHEGGDNRRAIQAMIQALQLYPEFEEAREFLTKVLGVPLPAP